MNPPAAPSLAELIASEVGSVADSIVSTRRALHRRPELAFREFRTAELAARRCGELGFAVRSGVGGTGVLADLAGVGPGPTVLLRADMDALPIQQAAPERPYASAVPGVMHACGHDGHVAAALGAAEVLARLRAHWPGRLRLCFQPAEETDEGAARMIADGALDGVDVAVGLHLQAGLQTGTVAVGPGVQWASSDRIRLTVRGRGGHAGSPEGTVDPIAVGAAIVLALRAFSTARPADRPAVATIGQFLGGTAPNVVPDHVVLDGTVRLLGGDDRAGALEEVEQLVRGVAAERGATVDVVLGAHCPAVVCDPAVTALVQDELAVGLREPARLVAGVPSTASDDMGRFLQSVPGCYFRVGISDLTRSPAIPHHHPAFDMDERALPIACEALARAVVRLLRSYGTPSG